MLCAKFGWNWQSGSGEEDENEKSLRQPRQRRRRTTADKFLSKKLTWVFGCGELKTQCLDAKKYISWWYFYDFIIESLSHKCTPLRHSNKTTMHVIFRNFIFYNKCIREGEGSEACLVICLSPMLCNWFSNSSSVMYSEFFFIYSKSLGFLCTTIKRLLIKKPIKNTPPQKKSRRRLLCKI